MHTPRALLVLATSIVLSACGGGGGGGEATAPAVTPTPAPYIPPAADAVSADAPLLTAVAIPMVAGSLIISEVSSGTYIGDNWIEIYNPNLVPVDISGVKLRSSSNAGTSEFTIPSTVIAAKGYVVVAAKSASNLVSSQQIAFVDNGSQLPYWTANGFVELFNPITNTSVDFVRFGTDTTLPKTPSAWTGTTNAPALPVAYGSSLVRPAASINNDTNSAIDFQLANFVTPAGPNDVPANSVDADNDGIPDSAEVPGGTFAGLNLYAMGARAGVKDIFIELDYMSSSDEGVKPRPEALKKVVDAFARKGIAIHFDAGTNFANYNLGNTQSVLPFNRCLDLGDPQLGCADVYALKAKYFDLRRQPIFHYAVAGYEAGAGAGIAGLGEISGNDFNMTLGNLKLTASNNSSKNFLINQQASTLLHELGHNLGLRHGGFESNNYKPNYISTMNYLYSTGIPPNPAGANAGQRWYIQNGMKNLYNCSATVEANMCSDSFIIDFSDGSSKDLNETNLFENDLLGRGTSAGAYIDWNGDNQLTNVGLGINIDSPDNYSKTILKDYNDWQNLNLAFSRQVNGARSLRVNQNTVQNTTLPEIHLLNDRQPVAQEHPTGKTP